MRLLRSGRLLAFLGCCGLPASSALAEAALPPSMRALEAAVGGLTTDQRRRAEQLTSLFENDSLDLRYEYIEDIGDGRGFTAGRAGFTTATGDLVEVVERYRNLRQVNVLVTFIPELKRVAAAQSRDTSGLAGLPTAWTEAANDPLFRRAQDQEVETVYFQPAMAAADALGLRTALGRAVLYDTIIQHGNGGDPDGLSQLVLEAKASSGDPGRGDAEERAWVKVFVGIRRAHLAHAADPATRAVWALSVTRCDVFLQLIDEMNFALDGPIRVHSGGYQETIP